MFYLKIKCGCDPYELGDYLDFYFNNLEELYNFATTILTVSDYEVIIGNCGEENE